MLSKKRSEDDIRLYSAARLTSPADSKVQELWENKAIKSSSVIFHYITKAKIKTSVWVAVQARIGIWPQSE